MFAETHTKDAFETAIEAHLLQNGYVPVARKYFDRERAIFPGCGGSGRNLRK